MKYADQKPTDGQRVRVRRWDHLGETLHLVTYRRLDVAAGAWILPATPLSVAPRWFARPDDEWEAGGGGMKSEPKSRGIIFDAESVRGILAGTKTMTRRVMKAQPADDAVMQLVDGQWWDVLDGEPHTDGAWGPYRCPYGGPGDTLWAREVWWHHKAEYLEQAGFVGGTVALLDGGRPGLFHANPDFDPSDHPAIWQKRSPRFMPRWASRLTLEVLDVRVERLQSISPADAIAEGIPAVGRALPETGNIYTTLYKERWDAINGRRKGATWADSPWCWCITFRRVP